MEMAELFRRKSILLVAAGLLTFVGAGFNMASPATAGQTASGGVTNDGFGSFIIKSKGSQLMTLNVGR